MKVDVKTMSERVTIMASNAKQLMPWPSTLYNNLRYSLHSPILKTLGAAEHKWAGSRD